METEIALHVPQSGLQEVYHHLKVFVRNKKSGKAVLTFDGNLVHFVTPEMDIGAPATGNWPGQARVGMAVLMALASNPPAQDPLEFRVANGQLHIGPTFSCKCAWHPARPPLIRMPIDYDDGTLIAVPLKCTAEDIELSGLTTHVAMARRRLQNRLKAATRALSYYHVTEDMLRELVDKALKNAGILGHIDKVEPGQRDANRMPHISP